MGQSISVPAAEISDWMFVDNGRLVGGETLKVLRDTLPPDESHSLMDQIHFDQVCLRDLQPDDLPRLFEFNLDPEANRLAATIARDEHAFAANWTKALADPNVVAKAICVGGVLAGSICCFERDGSRSVGYWLSREFWGRGIASRALELLLEEVTFRPLHAQVASSNSGRA